VKGQLVADVLNSQHAGTAATWRINTNIVNLQGVEAYLAAVRLQLVKNCFAVAASYPFFCWHKG